MKTRSTHPHHLKKSQTRPLAGGLSGYGTEGSWGNQELSPLNRDKKIKEEAMDTTRYKIGDLIDNKNGLELQVQEIDDFYCKKDVIYKTVCTKCGYIFEKVAKNLEIQKICARCEEKSVSIKYDADGTCISINGISPAEYIYDLMATYNLSGFEASELCIQILRQKPVSAPVQDRVTV